MPRLIEWYTPSVLDDMPEPADQRDPHERRVAMATEALGRIAQDRALQAAREDRFARAGLGLLAAQARERREQLDREEAEMRAALAAAQRDDDAKMKETAG